MLVYVPVGLGTYDNAAVRTVTCSLAKPEMDVVSGASGPKLGRAKNCWMVKDGIWVVDVSAAIRVEASNHSRRSRIIMLCFETEKMTIKTNNRNTQAGDERRYISGQGCSNRPKVCRGERQITHDKNMFDRMRSRVAFARLHCGSAAESCKQGSMMLQSI